MGTEYYSEEELQMLNQLDKIEEEGSEDENIHILDELSSNVHSDIRNRVAEVLVGCTPSLSESILLKLLNDTDEIVRVNACDSLCYCISDKVIEALKIKAKNDTYLVRGYAVMSLGDIALSVGPPKNDEIHSYLLKVFLKEKSIWVKIHYYYVLYTLGDLYYLQDLLQQLHNIQYRIRIITIRSLEKIIAEDNKEEILFHLKKRMDIEKSSAVLQNIIRVVNNANTVN